MYFLAFNMWLGMTASFKLAAVMPFKKSSKFSKYHFQYDKYQLGL